MLAHQPPLQKLLIANRGEIALRIIRTAKELGIQTVAVYSPDDVSALHARSADEAYPLTAVGPAAYLDGDGLLTAALNSGCDAIHPGYGFLAESASFAARIEEAGIAFVGPRRQTLSMLGDKSQARLLATGHGVPVPAGTGPVSAEEALAFLQTLGPASAMMLKAKAGGGGRGIRVVRDEAEVADAHARCRAEALKAFGSDELYAEQLVERARHIEVQVLGDGTGSVIHIGERECSVQRRHQKLVEIAPSPTLSPELRAAVIGASLTLARAVDYQGLGTFEFLVPENAREEFFFIEANPRLQVEHTVTELVTGLDLVSAGLFIAGGSTLAELALTQPEVPIPQGFAIEARVNTERMDPDGSVLPISGLLTAFVVPGGTGIRVDSAGYAGYTTNPGFDSLLAKVIAHSPAPDFPAAARRLGRALGEFEIAGPATNLTLLGRVIAHPDFTAGRVTTDWLDQHVAELAAVATEEPRSVARAAASATASNATSGGAIDRRDPLAALEFFRGGEPHQSTAPSAPVSTGPRGAEPVSAPLAGTVSELLVEVGDRVGPGQVLVVLSALKMEHDVRASVGGVVRAITVRVGETIPEDHPIAFVEAMDTGQAVSRDEGSVDLDYIRPKLAELFERRRFLEDEQRPAAVERRHRRGRRTVRENIDQLIDPGTWVEYGGLALAAQRRKRSVEELIWKTPADGLVAGIGSVNGEHFDPRRARTMFISYDDTVFAGTQGGRGHLKTDRMMDLANELSLPVIFHAEGAGGRSGDTDGVGAGHPVVQTWEKMCRLSGKVPMIGVTAGWCYAGNAAILGVTDIIIATEDALIAMGGPATIEGTGMGAFLPEEVGAMSDLAPAGSVDIVTPHQDAAIAASKRVLSYFQGSIDGWEAEDQRLLRHIIPERRGRSFDVRQVISTIADQDSVTELRPEFGHSMVTAFIRIEGHPFGLTANNNAHLGGAIDSQGSDKVARFWQLCDAFNIPIVTLVDTPGMMVGPEVERSGLIRHCSRLFVTGVNLRTPRFSVILRNGYALGALSVMTGSARAPVFTVGWPGSEYGGMNVEAGVLLSNREELGRIEDVEERAREFGRLVAEAYHRISALEVASRFGLDDVIDPAETRQWIVNGLLSVPEPEPLRRGRAQFVDTW